MQENGRNRLYSVCTGGKLSSYCWLGWRRDAAGDGEKPVHLSAASPAGPCGCSDRSVSRKSVEITELRGRVKAELVEQRPFHLPLSDCLEPTELGSPVLNL